MKTGDILELQIVDEGMGGEGVAKTEGIVVFVPFTLTGEKVRAEIVYLNKSFARAKVIKLLVPSPYRVEPPCPYFRKCGGCDIQHVSPEKHAEIKRREVINCFVKNAKLTPAVDETVQGAKRWRYRNKMQMPVAELNGKIVLGFYRENTHVVIPIDDCPLQEEGMKEYASIFVRWANKYRLTAYNEYSGKGLLRHFVMRKIGDIVSVTIVINGVDIPHLDRLLAMYDAHDKNYTLHVNINKKRGNAILGDRTICKRGPNAVTADIGGVKAEISPISFMQVNDEVRDMLYKKVYDMLPDNGIDTIIEAYSGIGVLSNIVCPKARRVYGIEIVREAVANADALAKANGNAEKIKNICGDAAAVLPALVDELNSERERGDIAVILDPPRKGCDPSVIDAVLRAAPESIIYISCNPSTLARDAALLSKDYDIASVTPFDMFPQTSHVECVVLMTKNDKSN